MVRNDDAINPPSSRSVNGQTAKVNDALHLNGFLCILHALNAFQTEWLSTTDPLPLFHRPLHLFPCMRSAMPDILINPFRTCLLGILLRINASLCQSFQENWILQAQIPSTMLMVECIVANENIVVSPGERPGVRGNYASIVSRVEGALQHGNTDLVIVTLIELEEPRTIPISFSDILDAVASGGREAICQIQLLCHLGDRELAGRVVDAVDADRGKTHWGGHPMAEDLGCAVSCVRVDQLPGYDAMTVEGLSVCKVGPGQASIAGGVVPGQYR